MQLTESKIKRLRPVLDKYRASFQRDGRFDHDAFEDDFREALGERSNDTIERIGHTIGKKLPEYAPLIVYWIEKSCESTGPNETQKVFLADLYGLASWKKDEVTRSACEQYLARSREVAQSDA